MSPRKANGRVISPAADGTTRYCMTMNPYATEVTGSGPMTQRFASESSAKRPPGLLETSRRTRAPLVLRGCEGVPGPRGREGGREAGESMLGVCGTHQE